MTNPQASDPRRQPDVDRIQKCLDELGEFFDTVQIFATRHNTDGDDGTEIFHMGVGNWYARYGQVKEWIIVQEERARINERGNDE